MVPREAEDWPLPEDMGQRTGQGESSVLGRVAVHRIDVGGSPLPYYLCKCNFKTEYLLNIIMNLTNHITCH